MRVNSYILSAKTIIELYKGEMPLAAWLKNYFREHKKFGSKDRKHIAHLCYCYYRVGKAFENVGVEERIKAGLFLCAEESSPLLQQVSEDWNNAAHLPVAEKMKMLNAVEENIFPFNLYLSSEIDLKAFNTSLLIQPKLYLRIRPQKKKAVVTALQNAGITFESISEDCVALDNSTKIDEVLQIDKDAVIQDKNSQQVINLLDINTSNLLVYVWDCCAASGGKSILLFDTFKNIDLTVSDIRPSILNNLKKRFAVAGIKNYRWFVTNAATSLPPSKEKYDLIICDAPCSGSGTWSRTPEQQAFFTEDKIDDYANLQKSITANVAKSLKPGGKLLYITCSVFKKENEEVVDFMKSNLSLKLQTQAYFKGYSSKADTLFAAVLIN